MTEKQIINKLNSLKSLNELMAKELQVLDKSLSHFNGRAARKGLDKKGTTQVLANRFKTIVR